MKTVTFYGEVIGDREMLPGSKCTCVLDRCCLEHSEWLEDPGQIVCDADFERRYNRPYMIAASGYRP